MTKTKSNHELGQCIEQLVQEHIAAIHQKARDALDRAFAGAAPRRSVTVTRAASSGRRRRAAVEVSALGERLYQVVCAKPGETIGVLAREMGSSARELHRPLTLLKGAGRVRSVGQRRSTRYFPRGHAASA